MQRFFVSPDSIKGGLLTVHSAELAHQFRRVLRLSPGDEFVVLDNTGAEFRCSLVDMGKERVEAKVVEQTECATESACELTLYQAMPKKAALFELILQKGTELGVTTFVPLMTERSERERLPRADRLERIIREAAEQSERGVLPKLLEPVNFSDLPFGPELLVLHSRGELPYLGELLGERSGGEARGHLGLVVGPEGGLTEAEVDHARKTGSPAVTLGPRILRTETAAISAASIALLRP
ncbi:hypothetical protein CO046_04125 [Candidatus Peregrinibacteria bacterium CG_4_9_14_0_2_um_filter_53_11]|nr:MAG: hypothetical protein CO046_04125 [Candidatus Peregrinibacteria bacterium CG_4_9_14_0_2_um_filter_53_11]